MAIKSTLVTPPNKAKEIDWGITQTVVLKDTDGCTVVATTGKHSIRHFCGVPLFSDDKGNVDGGYSEVWLKEKFTPITTPITITFGNE